MPDFFSVLYGIYFFTMGFVLLTVSAAVKVVTFPFDKTGKLTHHFSSLSGHHFIRVNPGWSVKFDGLSTIEPNMSYVFVSNHQSLMDILVLYGIMRPFKWVSKEEMFRVPVIGWTLTLNQYVRIRRGNGSSTKEMLKSCRYWLSQKTSVMMFPEGTRSPDGEIQKFRYGAFKLAADADVPILPIVIDGTRQIMRKGSLQIGFHSDIRVKALAPVYPKDFNYDSHALSNYVRSQMIVELSKLRQEAQEQETLGMSVA
ncbi:MAG: 1-acyl-sn-glycerol-3-phosphate acyltransferase [Candidatus Obscuribacterales bacterium]|nr:1-acyl-sn-glycerol-3-phosphate acyltransferase [Candidatus Obscuribacterales bacterium]